MGIRESDEILILFEGGRVEGLIRTWKLGQDLGGDRMIRNARYQTPTPGPACRIQLVLTIRESNIVALGI